MKTGAVCKKKVQVGKDQEKAQSEKDSHSKNRGGKKQTNNQILIPGNISLSPRFSTEPIATGFFHCLEWMFV